MAMSREKRLILQENHMKLTDNIEDIDRVVSYLLSAKCITRNMEEDIMAKPRKRERIRELLMMLPKRGEKAFDLFYEALVEAEEHIAAGLIELHVTNPRPHGLERQSSVPIQAIGPPPRDQLPAEFPDPQDTASDVIVKPCSDKDSEIINKYQKSLEPFNKQVYTMKKGLCLLYYNAYFSEFQPPSNLQDLEWDQDVQKLSELFEKFNFEVELKNNLTIEELQQSLDRWRKKDLKEYDCLVIFILTHGERGDIYGIDGKKINSQEIVNYFYSNECPDLKYKPKLFFIHAPTVIKVQTPDSGDSVDGAHLEEVSIKQALEKMKVGEAGEQADVVAEPSQPRQSDIYVNMSTTAEALVEGRLEKGSLFIQALVYAFKNYAHFEDIFALMTKVKLLINMFEQKKNKTELSIGSFHKSSLSKELYFFPGLTGQPSN